MKPTNKQSALLYDQRLARKVSENRGSGMYYMLSQLRKGEEKAFVNLHVQSQKMDLLSNNKSYLKNLSTLIKKCTHHEQFKPLLNEILMNYLGQFYDENEAVNPDNFQDNERDFLLCLLENGAEAGEILTNPDAENLCRILVAMTKPFASACMRGYSLPVGPRITQRIQQWQDDINNGITGNRRNAILEEYGVKTKKRILVQLKAENPVFNQIHICWKYLKYQNPNRHINTSRR